MAKKDGQAPSNEELWELLQEQRKRRERLKAELEKEREEKRSLARRVAERYGTETGGGRMSRAGLLKAAVVGAAGLAGAGTLGQSEPQIAAAAGSCGDVYSDDRFLAWGDCPPGPSSPGGVGFDASPGVFSIGVSGLGSKAGVQGSCQTAGFGVLGVNSGGGSGVYGTSSGGPNGIGVLGEGPNGVVGKTTLAGYSAVYGGAGTNGVGVYGIADGSNGVGISGQGGSGRGGQFAGSQAQLSLVASSSTSPPTSNAQVGDLFLDANAGLWLCTFSFPSASPPEVWKPLSAMVPIAPVRELDTRTGSGGYSGPQATGSILTLTMTNDVIPFAATGVIGTLRAYAPTGPGYLTAYPGNGTPPTTSNVNFYPNPSYPASYAVADLVVVGVTHDQEEAGAPVMSIYVGGPPGSATQVVFDISGYIA